MSRRQWARGRPPEKPEEPALCAGLGSLGDECIFGVFRKISFFLMSSRGGKGREGETERPKAGLGKRRERRRGEG